MPVIKNQNYTKDNIINDYNKDNIIELIDEVLNTKN